MINYIAYVNDQQADQDEDKEDLLRRCTKEYGYDFVMSEKFVIRKGLHVKETFFQNYPDEKEQEIPPRS